MKDKLPPSILGHKKIGFDIPVHEWLRGPLRSLAVDNLWHCAPFFGELFNVDVIAGYLKRHLDRKANVGYHLWGLLILFLWMQKWKIQVKPSATQKPLLQARAGVST
jgi:asparagine synthase (glutamine-hydrolysing)